MLHSKDNYEAFGVHEEWILTYLGGNSFSHSMCLIVARQLHSETVQVVIILSKSAILEKKLFFWLGVVSLITHGRIPCIIFDLKKNCHALNPKVVVLRIIPFYKRTLLA